MNSKIILISTAVICAITVNSCGIKQTPHSSQKKSIESRNKNEMNIEDKLWEIIELNGKSVDGNVKTHYLIFHSKDGQLEAKVNCNINLRAYTITDSFRLKINSGLSTLMACPDNLEYELNQALDKVDNYTTSEKSLSLNKGRTAPLIRLILTE